MLLSCLNNYGIRMKKLIPALIVCFAIVAGCKQHSRPIKWEKPGDKLVGEWIWSKGTHYYPDYQWEKTDYGAFYNIPALKMAVIAVFKFDGTAQMITEMPSRTDTTKCKWSVNGDTLKIINDKNGRVSICTYKIKDDKFILDHLTKTPRIVEEYTRE